MSLFKLEFDIAGLEASVNSWRDEVQGAIRPAAQAGIQVLYESARRKVRRSTKGHWFHGTSFRKNGTKYWFEPGSLFRSIYQVYSKDNSNDQVATYHLSWNYKEAPYGHMVEYGTRRARARSFLNATKALQPFALEISREVLFDNLKSFK